MASLRVQLKSVLELYMLAEKKEDKEEARKGCHEAAMQAVTLASRKDAVAISCNLAGDLTWKQYLCLIDALRFAGMSDAKVLKPLADETLNISVKYYRKALRNAESCMLTAVKCGRALTASGQFDEANQVLESAMKIVRPDDPIIHNIEITQRAFRKEEVLAHTKERIKSELLYIEVARKDSKVSKILKQLGNARCQNQSLLKAAADLADAQPDSVRARLLYPLIVTSLLGSGRLIDRTRGVSLSTAIHVLKNLSVAVPTSLVVSSLHAKLLVTLGFLDDSEKECVRALEIENPMDPWEHDIPLGSTSGDICDARIKSKRHEIACIMDSIVRIAKVEFNKLSEEEKFCFLTIKAADLLHQDELKAENLAAITKAIEKYKSSDTWVSWTCPGCGMSESTPSSEFLMHVWCIHFCTEVSTECEIHFSDVAKCLESANSVPVSRYENDVFLARGSDDEGTANDYICLRSVESLFNWALLPGEKHNDIIGPNEALRHFLDCLASFSEDEDGNDALKEAWLQLLSSVTVDNREILFDAISTIKWMEMKVVVEEQILKTEAAATKDVETPTEEFMPEIKAKDASAHEPIASAKKGSKKSTHYHAFKYGHEALQCRCTVVLAPPPAEKPQDEDTNDVYYCKKTHTDYIDAVADESWKDREVCSACFFERGGAIRSFTQILHHFVQLHLVVGVRCPVCRIRFVSASALSYHLKYCHNESPKSPD